MEKLAENTYLIDGYDLGLPNRTGIYVLDEEELTIIETGPSLSYPHIIAGLKEINRHVSDISHIVVTHVHLDHSGGAGQLMQEATKALLHVHPRGAKHLSDPEKLIQGARFVYGNRFDSLFAPVLPVDQAKIIVHNDNDTLRIGKDRTLTFWHTPGHALHHFSIIDQKYASIFTGDTVGIYYRELSDQIGKVICVPSTSPTQFDDSSMKESWARIQAYEPKAIYFGHYGKCADVKGIFDAAEQSFSIMINCLQQQPNDPEALAALMLTRLVNYFDLHHLAPKDVELIKNDCSVSALGLVDAVQKSRIKLDG